MRILFVFILSILTTNAQAEIHIWVDDKGKKHFSDSLPDHLKHKTSTVDYSSSIPTAAEREEATRIYKQSKKHANSIATPNRYKKNSIKDEKPAKKDKHLTRNDKIKLRQQEEAKACDAFLAAKRCSLDQAPMYGLGDRDSNMTTYNHGGSADCGSLKRPPNCFEKN